MAGSSPNVLQFKVSLQRSKPLIWRRILVPEDYSFYNLHLAIQDIFEWKNCHLHQFIFGNRRTDCIVSIGMHANKELDMLLSKRVQVSEFFFEPKSKAVYEYDLGDTWYHDVVLEKILPAEEGLVYPQCVAGRNAAPPEESGGYGDFEDLLEYLGVTSSDEEGNENLEYLKQKDYYANPKKFDPKAVVFGRKPEMC